MEKNRGELNYSDTLNGSYTLRVIQDGETVESIDIDVEGDDVSRNFVIAQQGEPGNGDGEDEPDTLSTWLLSIVVLVIIVIVIVGVVALMRKKK